MHKPLNATTWDPTSLPVADMYVDDFSCGRTSWGYEIDTYEGKQLVNGMERVDLQALYQLTDYSFFSVIWRTGGHSDLFITSNS